MQQMAAGLSVYSQLTVIGPKGCAGYLPKSVKVYEVSAQLAPYLLASTMRAILACRSTKFDLVIGGSGLNAVTLRILTKLFGYKTLVYLHGLDIVVQNFLYQRLFVSCLPKIDKVFVNSSNTRKLATQKGVAENRIHIIHPGTKLPALPDTKTLNQFRDQHGLNDKKIMLFVGRMTRRKGLSRFIALSLPLILESVPQARLVVVGENPSNSLDRRGEQAEILAQISHYEYEDQVIFLGKLNDHDLEVCYAAADVQIFPLIAVQGDVEGFGMIAIEAAALGTPTIAFDLGGVADAVSAKNGQLIPSESYDLFAQAVSESLLYDPADRYACIELANSFSWSTFNKKVRTAILGEQD